jgi:hypothetical protein
VRAKKKEVKRKMENRKTKGVKLLSNFGGPVFTSLRRTGRLPVKPGFAMTDGNRTALK